MFPAFFLPIILTLSTLIASSSSEEGFSASFLSSWARVVISPDYHPGWLKKSLKNSETRLKVINYCEILNS